MIENAYNRAKKILKENIDILHALAESLLEKETVLGKELDELIHSMRPDFEFPSKPPTDQKKSEKTKTEDKDQGTDADIEVEIDNTEETEGKRATS